MFSISSRCLMGSVIWDDLKLLLITLLLCSAILYNKSSLRYSIGITGSNAMSYLKHSYLNVEKVAQTLDKENIFLVAMCWQTEEICFCMEFVNDTNVFCNYVNKISITLNEIKLMWLEKRDKILFFFAPVFLLKPTCLISWDKIYDSFCALYM